MKLSFVAGLICLPLAGAPTTWQTVNQIGGPIQAVTVEGSIAYVGAGLRLVSLDISDPGNPREIGVTPPFRDFVRDVAVQGPVACVAAGGGGLRVMDVSDPAHPTELGAWQSPGYAEGVALAGNMAYVADGSYGLRMIDVSAPKAPVEVGSAYVTNYAFKVAVNGKYAYLAAAGAGLLIAGISDPSHPVETGTLPTGGYAYGVAVAGNMAYVAAGWGGFKAVNVANPAQPVLTGAYQTPGWAFGIALSATTAYVADAFRGLRVLDISDPANPAEVASVEIPQAHAAGVAVSGTTVLVADRKRGLRVLDVSDLSNVAQTGFYGPLSDVWSLTVAGHYAYAACLYRGMFILDISDPLHLVQVGQYEADGMVVAISVEGDYAYLAVGGAKPHAGLEIVNISNAANPVLTGYLPINFWVWDPTKRPLPEIPRDMKVASGIAYITTETALEVIDVHDPANPNEIGYVEVPQGGPSLGLVISGTLALVAQETGGFMAIDISDPTAPTVVGVNRDPNFAQDVDAAGNRAVVVGWGSLPFAIIDISDPRHPVTLGSLANAGGRARGIVLAGNRAYVGDGGGGVQVVDISDPGNPVLADSCKTPGYAHRVYPVGSYLWVADGVGGLLVLQESGTAASGLPGSASVNPWSIPPPLAPIPQAPPAAAGPADTAPPGSGANCVVQNIADNGPGTFRDCLQNAASGDTITFNPAVFPPQAPAWIAIASPLPPLSQGNLTIDASNAGVDVIGLQGLPTDQPGLAITSSGNTIRGLQIENFPVAAIAILPGAANNSIGGDRTLGSGPNGQGITFGGGSRRGLLISGSSGNVVSGSYFGTDSAGQLLQPLNGACLEISGGSRSNRIGGTSPGERNLITGCGPALGLVISGPGTSDNIVVGNYVGTDTTGNKALGGGGVINLIQGASNNRIGGTAPGEGNVVSGSGREGIAISDVGTMGNVVTGNYIGLNASGTAAIPNTNFPVWIQLGAVGNRVENNVMLQTMEVGGGGDCDFNSVTGNLIGTDASGMIALAPGGSVGVMDESRFNRIGGPVRGERNVFTSISVSGSNGEGNIVAGNYIGTDVTGSRVLTSAGPPGGNLGISVWDHAWHSFVGGTTAAEANVIAGLTSITSSAHNLVGGNFMGTDASGMALSIPASAVEFYGDSNVLQENTIANSARGIVVNGGVDDTIRRNTINFPDGSGIILYQGGNNMLAAPMITVVGAASVAGTACAGCEVEIFSEGPQQGHTFEGSTVAGPSGAFTISVPGKLAGPNITATATDRAGNTSQFANAYPIPK